jgi:putative methyltransferase
VKEAVEALTANFSPIYVDKHVPDLLVLKPGAQIHDHELVKTGKLILQDKSSCFSALCLVEGNKSPLRGNCLDACAAPGNKTSHLAASLASGKVVACDRNEKRLEMLDRRMKLLVSSGKVKTKHIDYLTTKPADYSNIKAILLDPSCSGSGIFTSLDRLADDDEEDGGERIEHLSNFQLTALKHSMSFASVERIVYSTCSLHKEENEMVAQQALDSNSEWQLVAPYCLREWKRRGQVVEGITKEQAQCMIRADRADDTNGFFVAYFERKGSVHTPKPEDASAGVVVPDGLSIYDGEFVTVKGVTKSSAGQGKPTKGGAAKGKSPKGKGGAKASNGKGNNDKATNEKGDANKSKDTEEDSAKTDPDGSDKPAKIVAKKKAKKLAWKQRQLEQKKQRLLSKEK